MTVLIVDDEPAIRDTLRDALEDEGYKVTTAANGAEALERLAELTNVCTVILDLLMPVMDGLQLLETIRADPKLAGIPLIVATSDPSRAPGDVPIMKKPLNLNLLIERVQRACGECREERGPKEE